MVTKGPAIVGLLRCQVEPYRRTLDTVVHSCTKTDDGYDVQFQDTVLFPEGGGQPSDQGSCEVLEEELVPVAVKQVRREGLLAVHTVDQPLEPGLSVRLNVDWPRRWDHMQQHTGQHLLSAVLDKWELPTLGWGLGAMQCYVELTRKLTENELVDVQSEVNKLIRESRPITLSYSSGTTSPESESDTASEEENQSIDHKVPEDYDLSKGVLRVISIDGIDKNPCCGTHLRTTADIQAVVLLNQVANKGNSRLFFLAGNRVLSTCRDSHAKLRSINSLLSCQTSDIEDKISQLNLRIKDLQAQNKAVIAELGAFEAAALAQSLNGDKRVVVLHKPTMGAEYLRLVEKCLPKIDGTAVLVSGQGSSGGSLVITGSDAPAVASKAQELLSHLKGGGGKRWQGKVTKFEKGEIEKLLALGE